MAYRAIIISLDVKLDLKNPFTMGQDWNISSYKQNCLHRFHKFLHHSDHHYSLVVVCMCYECSKGCFFLLQNLQLENVETCFATMSCVILSLRQILSLVPTMSEIWTCLKLDAYIMLVLPFSVNLKGLTVGQATPPLYPVWPKKTKVLVTQFHV